MCLPEGINPKPVGEELASGAGRNELCKQGPRQLSAARQLCLRAYKEGKREEEAGQLSRMPALPDGVARALVRAGIPHSPLRVVSFLYYKFLPLP
jgi:hypothetical protein